MLLASFILLIVFANEEITDYTIFGPFHSNAQYIATTAIYMMNSCYLHPIMYVEGLKHEIKAIVQLHFPVKV